MEQQQGILHIRPGGLGMTTLCPTSLGWLYYLKIVKQLFPNFNFDIAVITDEIGVPRLELGGNEYLNLEAFNGNSIFSLDPRGTGPQDPAELTAENTMLGRVRERQEEMNAPLNNLKAAFLHSLLGLQEANWLQAELGAMHMNMDLEVLTQQMQNACGTLSALLGDKDYFLDDLRDEYADKTSLFGRGQGITGPSIIDIKVAALSTLIMKCSDHEAQDVAYNSLLKDTMKRHISLRALGERLDSYFFKDEQLHVYDALVQAHPNLETEILAAPLHGSGKFGDVYRVDLPPNNAWELEGGVNAFKFSQRERANKHLELEISVLPTVPYANIVPLMGYGLYEGKVFMVTKWIPGGDLESQIGDLSWVQIERILKGLAYALYMVHKTAKTCIVDLKPSNILLDENYNPILCDFGLSEGSGDVHGAALPGPYHDYLPDPSRASDIMG